MGVLLLLSSFVFPHSMAFGCIQKNLHCCIQLSLDICHSYRNYFLGSVLLLVLFAYSLDVQIYILYLILHSNYKIVYRNILLGVFFRMFSCCCIHHIPLCFYTYFHVLIYISPRIYIYHYFPNMGIFLFSLSIGQLLLFFVLCLAFVSVFLPIYRYLLQVLFFRILLFFYPLFLWYHLFLLSWFPYSPHFL